MKLPRPPAVSSLARVLAPSPALSLALSLAPCAPVLAASDIDAVAATQAPVPAIREVLRVSIGAERSVATLATLRAPDAGEAVFWRRGESATLVVRTHEPVTMSGGEGFELRAIGRAWAAPEALLYLGTTREGPPVLVHHDAAGSRVLAVGADPAGALPMPEGRPAVGSSGCDVELEVFELLVTGATPLRADGSVRFPARLGAPCDDVQASIRYRDGRYSIESLIAAPVVAGEGAPASPESASGPWLVPDGAPVDGHVDGPGDAPVEIADGDGGAVERP